MFSVDKEFSDILNIFLSTTEILNDRRNSGKLPVWYAVRIELEQKDIFVKTIADIHHLSLGP